MFTINKIFYLFTFLMTISFSCSVFSPFASERNLSDDEQLINQIDYLFTQPSEDLHYDEVMTLSNRVISQRVKFSNETIAKTYLLLTNIALNKGELETAFQFTQDGLALTSQNQKTYPCLQVKLAEVLAAKKHYKELLTVTEQAIKSPAIKDNTKYLLLALSYRSVAYAMLSQHGKALADIQQVHSVINQNPAFSEHISLLSILANAYYHLGDYQTALTIQLKILKLRFNLNKLANVDQTYYQLGNAYFNLQRYNDAYNAYWEAKQYAEKKEAPIFAAYAGQGLGLTLKNQGYYQQAKDELLQAQVIFYQHSITTAYIETLITLAQISRKIMQFSTSVDYLVKAEKTSENITLSKHYIVFYQLLAQMYFDKGELDNAYFWQKKYSQSLLQNIPQKLTPTVNNTQEKNFSDSSKTRKLTLELAEQSELTSVFTNKYQQQQVIIVILTLIVSSIVFGQLIIWLVRRKSRSRRVYDAQDKTNVTLASPIQTKQIYQTSFNMAKKYSYTLTLGYISISNWQELAFKFNKKIVREVNEGIASLINEHLHEFESAGLINDGEYLLFFPHQTKEEINIVMDKILRALQLRFFANLGDFSVTLAYSVESPNFQDIDPYIFLSHLSAAAKSI